MTDLQRKAVVARFFVAGRPRTKGHLKPFPHRRGNGKLAITLHDRDDAQEWLQTLIKGIRDQVGIVPIITRSNGNAKPRVTGVEAPWPYDGPVTVDSVFYFERQIAVVGGEPTGIPIPSHSTPFPTDDGLGDADTLQRCVLDALTQSGLLLDDRLVVDERSRKLWVPIRGTAPGVLCEVRAA